MRIILLIALLYSATLSSDLQRDHSGGIVGIYDVMNQLEDQLGDIPPDVMRIALYRIKADSEHFSPGISQFIREQIEDIFRRTSRRDIVTAPELRTVRVDITDTSFVFSNTIPTLEDLWDLGRKLRVDGFLDGSITRTVDGDVILTLKLIRNTSGEIVWSGSFISGPNKKLPKKTTLQASIFVGGNISPINRYERGGDNISGKNVLYSYGGGLRIEEATTSRRKLFFGIAGGIRGGSLVTPDISNDSLEITYMDLYLQGDLTIAAMQKNEDASQYWLGIRSGVQLSKPIPYRQSILALIHGYRVNVTNHFGIYVGTIFRPFHRTVTNSSKEITLKPEQFGYDFSLYYTF